MQRDPYAVLGFAGQGPQPFAVYRPSNVAGMPTGADADVMATAIMLGIAHYSALEVMQSRFAGNQTRVDQLVAVAEGAGSPEAVLGALNASAQERETLIGENRGLSPQIEAERERRDAARTAPAIPVDELALAAQAAIPAEPKAPKPFRSLGQQLQAVANAALNPGRALDPKLAAIEDFQRAQAAITGASELVGSDGGFLVQTDFSNELMDSVFTESVLAALADTREIGANSNGVKFNVIDETSRATGSRYGGVRVYWLAEGGQKTASRPKLAQQELYLQKAAAMYVATDELLGDTTALESFARPAIISEFAFEVDDAMFRGTGVGKPLGILSADSLVSVTKETGQTAATFVYENALAMFARIHPRSLTKAAWYINQEVYPQLWSMAHVIGVGGVPAFVAPGGVGAAPGGTLLGRPVVPIEYASALGTVGDVTLADWSQYVLIRKGGIEEASSIHVYFDTDETAFRWVLRINGRPWRKSVVTPYKGSATTSPFVVLQTRS